MIKNNLIMKIIFSSSILNLEISSKKMGKKNFCIKKPTITPKNVIKNITKKYLVSFLKIGKKTLKLKRGNALS